MFNDTPVADKNTNSSNKGSSEEQRWPELWRLIGKQCMKQGSTSSPAA